MTHADVNVTLTGLDGSNPLAFLAALGLLRVLDHRARQHRHNGRTPTTPKLAWLDEGGWRPVLRGGPPTIERIDCGGS